MPAVPPAGADPIAMGCFSGGGGRAEDDARYFRRCVQPLARRSETSVISVAENHGAC